MNFLSKRAKRQQVYSVQNKALLLTLSFISFSSIYFLYSGHLPDGNNFRSNLLIFSL